MSFLYYSNSRSAIRTRTAGIASILTRTFERGPKSRTKTPQPSIAKLFDCCKARPFPGGKKQSRGRFNGLEKPACRESGGIRLTGARPRLWLADSMLFPGDGRPRARLAPRCARDVAGHVRRWAAAQRHRRGPALVPAL